MDLTRPPTSGTARSGANINLDDQSQHNLYQDVVKRLDQSDGDPVTRLDAIFQLLHVQLVDLKKAGNPPSTQSRSVATWAFRWLLRRLSDEGQPALNLGLDYRSWMLLLHLIKTLPFNVVNQHLKSHDIFDVIAKALESIRTDEWSRPQPSNASDDPEDISNRQRWSLTDLIDNGSSGGRTNKSKKRKRSSTGPDQLSKPSAAQCFFYIVQTIRCLQDPCESTTDEGLRTWERRTILESNPKNSVRILANGLEIYHRILEVTGFVDSTQASMSLEPNFCAPLIQLRNEACRAAGAGKSQLALMTLDTCTLPALKLLRSLSGTDPAPVVHGRIEQQLQSLIAEACIHPYRALYQKQSRPITPAASNEIGYEEFRIRLQNAFQGPDLAELPQYVQIVFQIAFRCVRRDNVAQRTREDHWLRELFNILTRLSEQQSTVVDSSTRLLQTVNALGLKLSFKEQSELIEMALLQGVDGQSQISRQPHEVGNLAWELVAAVVRNNPANLTLQYSGIPPITEKLCQKASKLVDDPEAGAAESSQYDLVVSDILLPLMGAFAASRNFEAFVMLWSANHEEAWKQSTTTGKQGHLNLWIDERLLDAMVMHFKASLPDSRRHELLESFVEALEEEQVSSLIRLQSLILANCICAGFDQSEVQILRHTAFTNRLHQSICRWLTAKSKGESDQQEGGMHKWRGWRLFCDLLANDLVALQGPVEEVDGVSHASKLVRKASKHRSERMHSWMSLNEAAFAWLYVLLVVLKLDSAAVDLDAKSLLQRSLSKVMELGSSFEETQDNVSLHHMMITRPSRLALDRIMSTLTTVSATPWMTELFTEEMMQMLHSNSSRVPDETTEQHAETLTWEDVLKELRREAEKFSTVLQRRLISIQVQAFSRLHTPLNHDSADFSNALHDAYTLPLDMLKKKDREAIAGTLSQWLESNLLQAGSHEHSMTLDLLSKVKREGSSPTANDKVEFDEASQALHSVSSLVQTASSINTQENDGFLTVLRSKLAEAQHTLSTCEDPLEFALAFRTIDIVLKAPQLPLIGQQQADELLGSISDTASPGHKLNATQQADSIYVSLCTLFGNLLSHHRHRVNGRYHLVVTALKSLLWCLFEPQQGRQHPKWNTSTLSPRCAEFFCRLLTSLGDPSVSAARAGNKSRSKLNDPTKKARSIAGQHLSRLIISFCLFQLQGRLDPALREKINPGLYAIMDAMSQDVMQSMNAEMQAPERAMFQALYADWKRFGRPQG